MHCASVLACYSAVVVVCWLSVLPLGGPSLHYGYPSSRSVLLVVRPIRGPSYSWSVILPHSICCVHALLIRVSLWKKWRVVVTVLKDIRRSVLSESKTCHTNFRKFCIITRELTRRYIFTCDAPEVKINNKRFFAGVRFDTGTNWASVLSKTHYKANWYNLGTLY